MMDDASIAVANIAYMHTVHQHSPLLHCNTNNHQHDNDHSHTHPHTQASSPSPSGPCDLHSPFLPDPHLPDPLLPNPVICLTLLWPALAWLSSTWRHELIFIIITTTFSSLSPYLINYLIRYFEVFERLEKLRRFSPTHHFFRQLSPLNDLFL